MIELSNLMRPVSPFGLRMVRSKGSTSPLLKMEKPVPLAPVEDRVRRAILEGQAVTAAKDCLVATVRTDFLEALLKRL